MRLRDKKTVRTFEHETYVADAGEGKRLTPKAVRASRTFTYTERGLISRLRGKVLKIEKVTD